MPKRAHVSDENPPRQGIGPRTAIALRRAPVAGMLLVAAMFHLATLSMQVAPRYRLLDFSSHYVSALAMRDGMNPYSDNLLEMSARLNLDAGAMIHSAETPVFLLCFEPLTRLSPRLAHAVWISLNFVLLIASLWMLLAPAGAESRAAALSLAALAFLYSPIDQVFIWGQTQIVLVFLLVLAMRSLGRGRRGDVGAGAGLALAGLLRAFPLLMGGYLLARRKWRALFWMVVFCVGGALATAAITGVARCFSWVRMIAWNSGFWQSSLAFNLGLAPFVSRMFWYAFGAPLSPALELGRHLAVLVCAFAIVMLVWRTTPHRETEPDRDFRAYGLWIAAAIVLSPIAWPHYMALLLIPFATIAWCALEGRGSALAVWALVANFFLSALWLRFWAADTPRFNAGLPLGPSVLIVAVAELGFVVMMLGFLAAYWSAIGRPQTVQALDRPVRSSQPART
ncbi:MAG: glycosyltransferase family 87 protein [Candidatus Binataceae bacterium]